MCGCSLSFLSSYGLLKRSLHLKKSHAVPQTVPVRRHLVRRIGAHNGNGSSSDDNEDDWLHWMDVRAPVAEVIAVRREGSPTVAFVKLRRRRSLSLTPRRSTRTNCCPDSCQRNRVPDAEVNDSTVFQMQTPKSLLRTNCWPNFCRELRHFQTVP